jgi:hypothetical protein
MQTPYGQTESDGYSIKKASHDPEKAKRRNKKGASASALETKDEKRKEGESITDILALKGRTVF